MIYLTGVPSSDDLVKFSQGKTKLTPVSGQRFHFVRAGVTLGTRGFSRVRREFSVLAEFRHKRLWRPG